MVKRVAPLLGFLLLSACSTKLDPAEVNELLLKPSRGLLSGVELGDSWEKLKADHDKRYTVRDDENKEFGAIRQLRRDLDGSATNGFFITYNVDDQKNIKSYEVWLNGRGDNVDAVYQVFSATFLHLNEKLGNGVCDKVVPDKASSSSCEWPVKDGQPTVTASYSPQRDSAMLLIHVDPPAAKK